MKNQLKNIMYLSVLILCGMSCHLNGNNASDQSGSEKTESIFNYLNKNSDYIFDDDKLHTFELDIPDSLLAKIDADPAAEEYVTGDLIFEGETVSNVGIRYKGSVGSFVFCLSGTDEEGEDFMNPSGYKVCTKLSMKVDVARSNPDATFYGLKKLQFHAQNLDAGKLRERLGYHLYQEMGVESPRSVHVRLVINGQYSGIYGLTEQIDSQFAAENFSNGTGNLYKEIWPNDFTGNPYPEAGLIAALETNKDKADVSKMKEFGEAILAADENELTDVIEKWMDVDRMINYIAVDRAIRADDGAFHWYCNPKGCSNHNFYWYENPDNGKMYLIPWDMDNSFENIIEDHNPVTPIADDWGASRADCSPYPYGAMGIQQRSAICDKLTRGWASYTEKYHQAQMKLVEGPMAKQRIDELITKWSNQITAATQEAADIHEDATSMSDWKTAVELLRDQMAHSRNEILEIGQE